MEKHARYKFLEHTADVFIEAYGKSFEEAFDNAARAVVDTMIHIESVREVFQEKFLVAGMDLENLLYNWLETVLVRVTAEGKVYSSFNISITKQKEGFRLVAMGNGEEINPKKHKPKVEVKAATYHMMRIEKKNEGVIMRFLLDI